MGRGALPFRGRDTVPWVPAENKAEGAGPVGLLWTPRTGRGAGLGARGAALEASSGEGLSPQRTVAAVWTRSGPLSACVGPHADIEGASPEAWARLLPWAEHEARPLALRRGPPPLLHQCCSRDCELTYLDRAERLQPLGSRGPPGRYHSNWTRVYH